MKLHGKTVIITGGGNSTGQELTRQFLSKGCKVIAVDSPETDLQEIYRPVKNEAGDNLILLTADIWDRDSVERLRDTILAGDDAIDGLINNAGIVQPYQKLNGLDYESLARIFNINYHGTLYMTKYFLSHLLSRPEAHIVTAMAGNLTISKKVISGISKIRSSAIMLIEGLHSELLDTGVKVTTVFSGENFYTGNKRSNRPKLDATGTMMSFSASQAAKAIINAIEHNISRICLDEELNPERPFSSIGLFIRRKFDDFHSRIISGRRYFSTNKHSYHDN